MAGKARRKRCSIDRTSAEYARGFEDGEQLNRSRERGMSGRVKLPGTGKAYGQGVVDGRKHVPPVVNDAGALMWQGREIPLSNTAGRRVLMALAASPGKPIADARLKAEAGISSASDARLRGAIRDVRVQLRATGAGELADRIRRVRGQGYMFA